MEIEEIEGVLNKLCEDVEIKVSNPSSGSESLSEHGSSDDTHDFGDSVLFHGVTYLGASIINAAKSEIELSRTMKILNEQSTASINIILSIPNSSKGSVRLLDPSNESTIASFPIGQITFCARGKADSTEKKCFSFTTARYLPSEVFMFQCHCFRCDMEAAVEKVVASFALAFNNTVSVSQPQTNWKAQNIHEFRLTVDIKEEDSRKNFVSVPRDKGVFKLRSGVRKKIVMTLIPKSQSFIKTERCFGMLIGQGRNVRNSDMQLLDLEISSNLNDNKQNTFCASWDPSSVSFASFMQLFNDLAKDTLMFLTFAVDVVLTDIMDPVRFKLECKVKLHSASDSITWYYPKKPITENICVITREVEKMDGVQSRHCFEIVKAFSDSAGDNNKSTRFSLSSGILNDDEIENHEDDDDIVLSGTGDVSKDCEENMLLAWKDALNKWRTNWNDRPKGLIELVEKGIPEALRGEVWQLLSSSHVGEAEMISEYRKYISQPCDSDQAILRDINRTFPAHEYFKDSGGVGQESMFRICKAYSLRDAEVGYCQGISFITAALLIHMPEEQAYMLLVKIMNAYNLREIFKINFENLHCACFQLECLLKDFLPNLTSHFEDIGLQTHMYALQWFLTLFTAKFPLPMVFRVIDIFLVHGFGVIFAVALNLLKDNSTQLLSLDFEGALRYFRVALPKRYRSAVNLDILIRNVCRMQIPAKKLRKYEKEFALRNAQCPKQSVSVQNEGLNRDLQESILRLEIENDNLASELLEEKSKSLKKISSLEEENNYLKYEINDVRNRLRAYEATQNEFLNQINELNQQLIDYANHLEQVEYLGHRYKQIYSMLKDERDKDGNWNLNSFLMQEMEINDLEYSIYGKIQNNAMNLKQKPSLEQKDNQSSKSHRWLQSLKKTFETLEF